MLILHEVLCTEKRERSICLFSGTGTIGCIFLFVVLQEKISEGLHSVIIFENCPYLCQLPMQKGAFLIPKRFSRKFITDNEFLWIHNFTQTSVAATRLNQTEIQHTRH